MVVVSDLLTKWQCEGFPNAISSRIPRPMRGSVVDGCIVVEGPKILHDVQLTTGGPAHRPDVFTQHPESRPDTLAKRKLDPGLNPAVLPVPVRRMRGSARTARLETRRRVFSGGV